MKQEINLKLTERVSGVDFVIELNYHKQTANLCVYDGCALETMLDMEADDLLQIANFFKASHDEFIKLKESRGEK